MPRNRTLAALCALAIAGSAVAAPVPVAPTVADDIKFLPGDTNLFFVMRLEQLTTGDGFRKLAKEVPMISNEMVDGFRKEFGIEINNVELMVYGGNVHGDGPTGVFRLKTAVKPAVVIGAASAPRFQGDKITTTYAQETVGAYILYVPSTKWRESFCFINDKTIAFGRADELKKVLARDRKPDFSANLQAAIKAADLSASLTMVMDVKAISAKERFPMIPGMDVPKIVESIDGAVFTLKIGPTVSMRGIAVCKDAKAAEEVKKQAEIARDLLTKLVKETPMLPKELTNVPGMVKLSVKDNLGEATLSVKDDVVVAFFKAMMGGRVEAPKPVEAKPSVEKKP